MKKVELTADVSVFELVEMKVVCSVESKAMIMDVLMALVKVGL